MHVNTLGKVFLATLAAAVVGKATQTTVRGTPDQVSAVAHALQSSRVFLAELEKPGATVASVIEKLKIKQMSASEFESKLGIPWPF